MYQLSQRHSAPVNHDGDLMTTLPSILGDEMTIWQPHGNTVLECACLNGGLHPPSWRKLERPRVDNRV